MFSFVVLLCEAVEAYHQPDFTKGRNSCMNTLVSKPCYIKEKTPLALC